MTVDKPTIFVSPAEPRWLKTQLAETFTVISDKIATESRGVDISWLHDGEWHGVQRKTVDDLIASIGDRLTREVPQMLAGVVMPHVIIEGQVKFSNEGLLMRDGWGQSFTRKQWHGLVWSLQGAGVAVTNVRTGTETITLIRDLWGWSGKSRHSTLRQRVSAPKNDWGTRDSKAWSVWVLQGFDGIGPETAEAIVDKFGLPLRWTVDEKELLSVPGVGKVRAKALMNALGGAG